MTSKSPHGRLLEAAARKILKPIGCVQRGRSRVWNSDQRFWVIHIEFQPSGWSQGSYLNVGASWLWRKKKHLSFDYGYRVEEFVPFVDEDQFAPEAQRLAVRAAEEVQALRSKFSSMSSIAQHIMPDDNARAWPVYYAAVASGLAGDVVVAQRLFERLNAEPTSTDWHRQLQAGGVALAGKLPDRDKFRAAVFEIVEACRADLGLPPDPACLDVF